VLTLRRTLAGIRSNPRLSGTAITQDIAAARKTALAALDDAERYGAIAVQNIRDYLSKQTETKREGMDAVVYELQKAAAARRVDLLQAQGTDAAEIIRRASGDALALACLREDLTFTAGDTREDQVRLEGLLDALDRSETPLMSASKQAARILEAELQTGWANVQTSLALMRAEAGGASQTSSSGFPVGTRSLIAGWLPGSAVQVAFTSPDGGLSAPDTPTATGTTGSPTPAIAAQIAANAAARAAAVSASEAAMRRGRPNRDGQ